MEILRETALLRLKKKLKTFPVVAILGPRQCGKTTLAKQLGCQHFFDLENPRDLARLDEPQLALEPLRGLIGIDEIQKKADLFPLLRYLVDQKKKQKFLILGSASRDLIQQGAETLAGRISFESLSGFSLEEVGFQALPKLWIRGGFPLSFLAKSEAASEAWRESYIQTFLERDIPQLGIQIPAETLRRFWMMISHYHGQVLNLSELGRSFGISDMTARKYLGILQGTFMIRLLQPWFHNLGKRLVKSPKLYLRDSGLFHTLQSIGSLKQLEAHPKLGASWEGFALEQAIRMIGVPEEKCFFWATHAGAELDLFWQDRGKNWGVEIKYQGAPTFTKSMGVALEDLKLNHLWVLYPGKDKYPLHKKATALSLEDFAVAVGRKP